MKKIESLTMLKEKLKGGTLWDFSTSIQSEKFKKLKGDPLMIFFRKKKSHRAENTLKVYPLAPLSFLDVNILRKLSKSKSTSQARIHDS